MISYATTLIAGVPAYLLLRRSGRLSLGLLLAAGAVTGFVVAVILKPYLSGELFSIPLTPIQGAVLGAAVASAFWAISSRAAPKSARER